MHKNKWRKSKDAHRHSSKPGRLDAEMMNVSPWEWGWWCRSSYWGCAACHKANAECYCRFFFFFSCKRKLSSDFFQLSKIGTNWHKLKGNCICITSQHCKLFINLPSGTEMKSNSLCIKVVIITPSIFDFSPRLNSNLGDVTPFLVLFILHSFTHLSTW